MTPNWDGAPPECISSAYNERILLALKDDPIQQAVQAKLERIRIHLWGEGSIWCYSPKTAAPNPDLLWCKAAFIAMNDIVKAKREAHNEWRGLKYSWL